MKYDSTLNTYLSKDMHEALKQAAKDKGLKMAELVRLIFKEWLEKNMRAE
jgi:hypothetical protein